MVNAATFAATPLVPGSLGTIKGSNLAGQSVAVTFDGLAAVLLYTSASQINLQVPAGLGAKTSATMVVTVDGSASAPQTVTLAPAGPSIFTGGVLNQDYSANARATPPRPVAFCKSSSPAFRTAPRSRRRSAIAKTWFPSTPAPPRL